MNCSRVCRVRWRNMLSSLRPEQKLSSEKEQLELYDRMTLSNEAEVSSKLLWNYPIEVLLNENK